MEIPCFKPGLTFVATYIETTKNINRMHSLVPIVSDYARRDKYVILTAALKKQKLLAQGLNSFSLLLTFHTFS